jgi:PH domain
LKRWKKRWFVLQDSTLYSFKEEKKYSNPTEIIDLRVFSSVKSSEDYTNRPHSFDVYSTDMVFSMVAATETEKEDWIRAIGRAIVISRTKSWQEHDNYS